MEPSTPVQFLPGVGPRRAEALARLEIRTVWDLLWHLPRTWLDRTQVAPLSRLVPGAVQTATGTVHRARRRRLRGRLEIFEAEMESSGGPVSAVWFHQPYLERTILPGSLLLLSGPVRVGRHGLEFVHPEHEVLPAGGLAQALHGGRIVPIYPLTAGITQKALRAWVREALDLLAPRIYDPLPSEARARLRLPELAWALEHVHFPEQAQESETARDRLAFDEFLLLQLAFGLVRRRAERPHTARPLAASGGLGRRFRKSLPFTLTRGQETCLGEILEDLGRDRPMNRLLQGDVGSGKTVVAALACLTAVEAGTQAAYMAPTEILALQQARLFQRWFEPLGVRSGLLLGRTRAAERRELLAALASGEIHVMVGTHSLLEDPVEFPHLGLVVVDEQHRFGVLQRARIRAKGPWPHCLVMSATPIPRTLSLTLYGDLDISVLSEMPAGRIPPRTRVVDSRRRDDLLSFVGKLLREGQRAFFVYPLVEESEQLDLRDATRMAQTLARHPALAGVRVGLLHGRMKGEEKEAAIAQFRDGSVPCLVTTTVVEVGVDVPQATIMVVEHPERFGLSQLHQLRGRVGRGGGESHMFLMRTQGSGEGLERLRVLVRESNGFRVAEEDLRLRGPGDLLGTAQHGLPTLKAGDLIRDPALLTRAREEAKEVLAADPGLSRPENARLRAEVLLRYGDRMPLYEVG